MAKKYCLVSYCRSHDLVFEQPASYIETRLLGEKNNHQINTTLHNCYKTKLALCVI